MKERNGRQERALGPERLSALCFQLCLMQRAGVPLDEGVAALRADAGEETVRPLLGPLESELHDGAPLSAALAACGGFPAVMVQTVAIGEAAGRLDDVLESLSRHFTREGELRARIRRASTFPALMALLIALVFALLIVRVLPVFLSVFSQLGLTLSGPAAALLRFGGWGQWLALGFCALLVLGALAALWLFRTKAGGALRARRAAAGKAGATALTVARSRFCSAMALMLSSGLPFDEALARAGELVSDTALAPRIARCRARMAEGASFPDGVRDSALLEGLSCGLLAAGFRAGAPAQAMGELAHRMEEQCDERLERLLSRLELGLLLALCAAVGLVLLSVMLPLLGMLASVGA